MDLLSSPEGAQRGSQPLSCVLHAAAQGTHHAHNKGDGLSADCSSGMDIWTEQAAPNRALSLQLLSMFLTYN